MPSPLFFSSVINKYLPEPHASLLNGIVFGLPLRTTRHFYENLKAVGLLHIVVLSGMNITILSSMVTAATSSLSRRVSSMLTIFSIIIFIWFVHPQAPIVRAGIMGILTSVSILYGRRRSGLYVLCISALIIALFWPHWLKTVSFQLSYGASIGIMLFGRVEKKKSEDWFGALMQSVRQDFRNSLAAQVFTAPVIFWYFKQISFIAPFANVLVSFLIAPLMIVGFVLAFLGKAHLYLALVPSYLAYGMTSYLVFVVNALSKIPFGYVKW